MFDIEEKARLATAKANAEMTEAEMLHCQALERLVGINDKTADADAAICLFWKSAEMGYLDSATMLGVAYLGDFEKFGLQRNVQEAVRCFDYAAVRGDHDAETYLAKCYADGIGVQKDLLRAKDLYAKAATGGCVGAIRGLSRVCILLGVNDDGTRILDEQAAVFDIK